MDDLIGKIQEALGDFDLPAWLFYGFQDLDPIATRILQFEPHLLATRRWFYLVPAQGKPSKLVDGWIAAGACSLFQKEGVLVVKCDGDRSFLSDRQLKTLKGGPFKLKFRMKSHAQGKVSVVYDKPSPAHMVNIPMKHDGEYHDYEVAIPDETLETIRLSLTKAEGTIEVDWIRILDNTGKTVRSWEF